MGQLGLLADGGAVWESSPISDRFLPCMRLPGGGRRGHRGQGSIGLDGGEDGLAERQSLAGGSGSAAAVSRTGHHGDSEAPVRACFRYISNHSRFLDYKGALVTLPTGSGEIQSGHRYVFQKRLKIAGSWWKTDNLKKMIALRVVRANRSWEDYWSEVRQEAA